MKKLLYAILAIPILCNSLYAATSTMGWNYYEKPGEKIITTPYAIFSSSRIIFTSSLGGIQWYNGTLSTAPVTSGGASAHADLTQLDYASSGHTGFASVEDTGTLKADIATHYTELKATGAALSALTVTVAGIQASTPSATSVTNWNYAYSAIDSSENWNTAYGWGDHGAAGYALEVDTLTIGTGSTQAAAGNHDHSGVYAVIGDTLTVGAQVQAYDADLDDLADGSLTGSKVGAGVPFASLPYGDADNTVAVGSHTHAGVYQPADDDLTDLADGELTGSKVGDGVAAANIAAGSLDTDVIVSSIAVNAVYPDAVQGVAYEHIRAGTSTIAYSLPSTLNQDLQIVSVGTATVSLSCSGNATTVTNGLYTTSVTAAEGVRVGTATVSLACSGESAYVNEIVIGACFQVYGATTTAGVKPIQISPVRDYAMTITTMTITVIGGTNVVGMIEQRAVNAQSSAGTDIWSDDVTAVTTHIGGTFADATVPANYAMYFVPTEWTGAVDTVIFAGKATRD